MNLLMVSPFYPSPTSGACTRVYHLLKALAHQYNVSLVVLTAATESDGEYPALDQMKLREVVKVPWPQNSSKRLQQAFSVLRGRSPRSEAYHIEGLQQVLDRLTARDNYDVVIFESVFLADYRLPHGPLVTSNMSWFIAATSAKNRFPVNGITGGKAVKFGRLS